MRILCDMIADDFLKNQDIANPNDPPSLNSERFLMFSKPYVRKSNLTNDRALIVCWESHLRFTGYDLYITILRRSYIPPVMDMYQDLVVCSKFNFDTPSLKDDKADMDELKKSYRHLVMTHRKIIDSIHQVDTGSQVSFYKIILEERANSLLMSEETMNFYQYNL